MAFNITEHEDKIELFESIRNMYSYLLYLF